MKDHDRIALSFLAIKPQDFVFKIYRRFLTDSEQSPPGMRWLPANALAKQTAENKAHRYAVSFVPVDGFDLVSVNAWINSQLTVDVLHAALLQNIQAKDIASKVEIPDSVFTREVAFILSTYEEGIREVMRLRAFALKSIGRFGFICNFNRVNSVRGKGIVL